MSHTDDDIFMEPFRIITQNIGDLGLGSWVIMLPSDKYDRNTVNLGSATSKRVLLWGYNHNLLPDTFKFWCHIQCVKLARGWTMMNIFFLRALKHVISVYKSSSQMVKNRKVTESSQNSLNTKINKRNWGNEMIANKQTRVGLSFFFRYICQRSSTSSVKRHYVFL